MKRAGETALKMDNPKQAKFNKVSITEAKRRFSELVERARRGERIGITKRGVLKAILQRASD